MDTETLRKELPRGAYKAIAESTGISATLFYKIIRGAKSSKRARVLKASAEYLSEYKAKEREALQAVEKALSIN